MASTSCGPSAAANIAPLPKSVNADWGGTAGSIARVPVDGAGGGGAVVAPVAGGAFSCARRWLRAFPGDARASTSTAVKTATAHRECLRMSPRNN